MLFSSLIKTANSRHSFHDFLLLFSEIVEQKNLALRTARSAQLDNLTNNLADLHKFDRR